MSQDSTLGLNGPSETEHRLSKSDEILEEAFQERVTVNDEGEEITQKIGLRLSQKALKNLEANEKRFRLFLSLYEDQEHSGNDDYLMLIPLANAIDRSANLAMRTLADALKCRLNFEATNSVIQLYNVITRDIEASLVEKYLQPYYIQMKRIQSRYHTAIKSTHEEVIAHKFSREDIVKDWEEMGIEFKKLFLSYEFLFNLKYSDDDEPLEIEDIISSDYSPEEITIIYENLFEKRVLIEDSKLLLLIENAYWSVGKKEKAITKLQEWLGEITATRLPWDYSELSKRYAERLEENEDWKDAFTEYGKILEEIKKLGKDRRFAKIKNRAIFCNLKSTENFSDTNSEKKKFWLEEIKQCKKIFLETYGDLDSYRNLLITEILFHLKNKDFEKVIELYKSAIKINYLNPLDDANFKKTCGFMILENISNDDSTIEIRDFVNIKIEEALIFYKEWGEFSKIISTLGKKIDLEKNKYKKSKLIIEREKWETEFDDINSKISRNEIDDDFIEYLMDENYYGFIENNSIELKSELNKKRLTARKKFRGAHGELMNHITYFSKLRIITDLENQERHCKILMEEISNEVSNSLYLEEKIELKYYNALMLENKYIACRNIYFEENESKNLILIEIGTLLSEIWKDLKSINGEMRWRRNVARLKCYSSDGKDWAESVKELRRIAKYYETLDSRNYYYTMFMLINTEKNKFKTLEHSEKWKKLLQDPRIPDDLPTRKEILIELIGELMREEKFSEALDYIEDIKKSIDGYANFTEIRDVDNWISHRTFRISNNLLKREIDCLISLNRFDDARKRISTALENGKISKFKALMFESQIYQINGDLEEAKKTLVAQLELLDIDGPEHHSYSRLQTYDKLIEISERTNDSKQIYKWNVEKYLFSKKHVVMNEKGKGITAQKIAKMALKLDYLEESYIYTRWSISHFELADLEDKDLSRSWRHAAERAVKIAESFTEEEINQQLGWREKAHECYMNIEEPLYEFMRGKIKGNIYEILRIFESLIKVNEKKIDDLNKKNKLEQKILQNTIKWRRKKIEKFQTLNILKMDGNGYPKGSITEEIYEHKRLYRDIRKTIMKYSKRVIEERICLWSMYIVAFFQYNIEGELDKKNFKNAIFAIKELAKSYESGSRKASKYNSDPFLETKKSLSEKISSLSRQIDELSTELIKNPNDLDDCSVELMEILSINASILKEMKNNKFTIRGEIELVEKNSSFFQERYGL